MKTDSLATMNVSSPLRAGIRIRRIELFAVRVPLKKEIKHASHSRIESDNLVVKIELANGQVGYGEGVPRSYVTGETVASTFETLAKHDWARQIGQPRLRRAGRAAGIARCPGDRSRSSRHGR